MARKPKKAVPVPGLPPEEEIAPPETLPHEVLMRIAQGKPITVRENRIVRFQKGAKAGKIMRVDYEEYEYYPTFKEQMAAAVAAAPYSAPKLAVKFVGEHTGSESVEKVLRDLAARLPS